MLLPTMTEPQSFSADLVAGQKRRKVAQRVLLAVLGVVAIGTAVYGGYNAYLSSQITKACTALVDIADDVDEKSLVAERRAYERRSGNQWRGELGDPLEDHELSLSRMADVYREAAQRSKDLELIDMLAKMRDTFHENASDVAKAMNRQSKAIHKLRTGKSPDANAMDRRARRIPLLVDNTTTQIGEIRDYCKPYVGDDK